MLCSTIVQLNVTKHVRWDLVSSQCWACTAQGAESANALTSGGSADGIRRTGAAQLLALSQDTIVAEKLADWAQLRADSPVQAMSLLRFYPNSSRSSAAAVSNGMSARKWVAGAITGIHMVHAAGVVREKGGSDAWDTVTIVAYPSRTALRDALLSKGLRRQWADVAEVAIFAVLPAEGATARL